MSRLQLRNVAIIAHVDHGKTTLVDGLLKQTHTFRDNQQVAECVMDSNALERERGITILAKNTVVHWHGVKINIIDTPGHADFGGEVERVLSMADGVLLLVDAAEGAMPQTRYVLSKAFQHRLKPIVVINKVDRPDARAQEVLNEVFDLFIDLDADDAALEFPVLYGSGREGWVSREAGVRGRDLSPLFETILAHIPDPVDDACGPLQFRVSSLDWSDYVGRIAIGRVHRGRMRPGIKAVCTRPGGSPREVLIRGVATFEGLGRRDVDSVEAGDLCAVHGVEQIAIGDSLTDLEVVEPLPVVSIDQPTMSIMLRVNDSPFAGRDGRYLTSRHLRERLEKELRTNVALRVEPGSTPDVFKLSGRGVMHLGVLLENMRREGYEFAVSKPEVILRQQDGAVSEPIELLTVDVPETATGRVIEIVGERRAEIVSMQKKGSFQRLEFTIPARGLIGVRTRILNATAGQATVNHVFHDYGPWRGEITGRQNGVMVSMAQGPSTFYAMDALRDRGAFFIPDAIDTYEGMVVGEHCKEGDIVVNLTREKKLTNVRSSTKEAFVKLPPPRAFGVEEALEYIDDDELAEITPGSVRLRKVLLKEKERKRKV
jgi:GTP-binding protein